MARVLLLLSFASFYASNGFSESVPLANPIIAGSFRHFVSKDTQEILEPPKEIDPKEKPVNLETVKLEKKRQFSFFVDFLYFKAVEDSLAYAERVPQNATFTPTVESISQQFEYAPAFRLGGGYDFGDGLWNLLGCWTRYAARPAALHATDAEFGILATLSIPVWGALGNSQVDKVTGTWELTMNVIDANVRRRFLFKKFSIAQVSGLKIGLIDQTVRVRYRNFRIDFPQDTTPHRVIGTSSFLGVGPELGVEVGYLLPKKFSAFFNGYFSCLVGSFNTKTVYKEFDGQPSNSKISIRNSDIGVSIIEQMQIGFDKRWIVKKKILSISLGYEIQVWQKQMRLNYFSSFVSPPAGDDLFLYGPFFKMKIQF